MSNKTRSPLGSAVHPCKRRPIRSNPDPLKSLIAKPDRSRPGKTSVRVIVSMICDLAIMCVFKSSCAYLSTTKFALCTQ